MYTLATMQQLRARLDLETNAADDERLWRALTAATARIERDSGRRFTPRLAALPHRARHPRELILLDDLLQLQRLANGDGRDIDRRTVQALPAASGGSVGVLRLTGSQRFSGPDAVQVTGLWGWHERWSLAWRRSVDRLQRPPLAATATALQVADSGRFHAGQLLRIGDEYLRLLSLDAANHTLNVERGAQGTTAATHNRGSAIDVYRPPATVTLLCLRLAAWLYREPDREPAGDLPADVADELRALRRHSAAS
ncbi:MAG: hypothetical protein OXP68_05690 [Anaerolineaceae bacterium]|nr:hypothetical protein [Anaerolineaceae bacterium]MDE0327572.1 hypothetical protein [Anaerolineaceae bacterium]